MVFSNLIFLYLFLPLCLAAYFLCRSVPAKNAVLIVFSLIFYASRSSNIRASWWKT